MEELINYYHSLLIIQYFSGRKARATIDTMVNLLWANQLLKQIRDGFDIDTAIGAQLDIIGIWVGVDRYVYQKPYDNHPWLSLIEISGPVTTTWQGGFAEIDNFDSVLGGFLTPDLVQGGKTSQLMDKDFRLLIKLKIIKNSISHTCKNIDDAVYSLFGMDVITRWDIPNHILYYEHTRAYGSQAFVLKLADKKNILPCPTGYRVIVKEISST